MIAHSGDLEIPEMALNNMQVDRLFQYEYNVNMNIMI